MAFRHQTGATDAGREHHLYARLIFPSSGGMGPEATVVVKKLAADIAA